jgi:hypothetical protein
LKGNTSRAHQSYPWASEKIAEVSEGLDRQWGWAAISEETYIDVLMHHRDQEKWTQCEEVMEYRPRS